RRGPSLFGRREADRRGVQVHESPHRLIHQGIRPRAFRVGRRQTCDHHHGNIQGRRRQFLDSL
ncbi:hypothetical protein, partial [Prevotella corporis]|uniref:hypothetical protein n=1 Tax=Prevotella corporis TaxID=28128 RepID=UPI001EE1B5FD